MSMKEKIKKYTILFYTIISLAAYIILKQITVKYILKNSAINNSSGLGDISTVVFVFLLEVVNALAGILLLRFAGKQTLKNLGFKFRKKNICFTLIGFTLLVLMNFMFTFITSEMNIALWDYEFFNLIVPLNLLNAVLVTFLFIGIGEEFLYRGFLFKALKPYGRLVQYAVNMLFFVSLHFLNKRFSQMYLFELITATFFLCYIYEKAESIWPGVILHGAVDFLALLFSRSVEGVSIVRVLWVSGYDMWDAFNLLYIISSTLLIILVWYFYKHQFKKNRVELNAEDRNV